MVNHGDVPRPITSAESKRIRDAQHRYERAQRERERAVQAALLARDREVVRALEAGARVTDVAKHLGITRSGVYQLVERYRSQPWTTTGGPTSR